MAVINNDEIVGKDVKKEIDDTSTSLDKLVNNLKALAKSMELVNKQVSNAQSWSQLNDAIEENAKTTDKVISTQKEALQVSQEEIKLRQLQRKEEKELASAREKERKEQEKQAKQTKENESLWKKQTDAHREATKAAKEAAIQYGKNSKEFKELADKANKLGNELKDIDASLGNHQRNVGNYGKGWNAIKSSLIGAAAAYLTINTASKVFTEVIGASQVTADKFEESLQGIKGAITYTATAIANANFKDFFQGLQDAYKAGTEYANAIDEAGDRQRALNATTAEANVQFANLKLIYQDVNRSKKERIDAIDQEIALDKELAKSKNELATKAYKDELKYIFATEKGLGELTDARQSEFEDFLKNRQIQGESVDLAKELISLEDRLTATKLVSVTQGSVSYMQTVADNEARADAKKKIEELTNSIGGLNSERGKEVLKWKDLLNTYTINDEKLDSLTQKYQDYKNSTADIINAEADLTKKRSGLIKSLDAENDKINKVTDAIKKEITQMEKMTSLGDDVVTQYAWDSAVKKAKSAGIDLNAVQKKLSENRIEEAKKLGIDLQKIESDAMAKTKANQEKALEDAKIYAEKKKELEQGLYDAGVGLAGALFERRVSKLDEEKTAIDSYYARILDNEALTEEQRSAIEAERDRKKQEIVEKQNKALRKQAIFEKTLALSQIAIATARGVAEALKMVPAAPLFVAYAAATGALQAATVMAQPIPQYKKGTKNAKGGLSEVAEEGAELVIDKKYGTWLASKRQYAHISKGSTVLTASETAKAIAGRRNSDIMSRHNESNSQQAILAKMLGENIAQGEKIEQAIKRQRPPVINIISNDARIAAKESAKSNFYRGNR